MARGSRAQHELYSPERPTAVVLSGTGVDGAYHAGVLEALQEAGVKIDLVGGRGVGALDLLRELRIELTLEHGNFVVKPLQNSFFHWFSR